MRLPSLHLKKKNPLLSLCLLTSIVSTRAFSLTMSTTASPATTTKPRLLCLHGKYQSGSTFSNKIAGARRKLARAYDLDFLDGPIRLNQDLPEEAPAFAWWHRDDQGVHTLVQEGLEYVVQHIEQRQEQDNIPYAGVVGFSQGGVVATALCCSGRVPSLKVVVTAGSPMVEEAFVVSDSLLRSDDSSNKADGYAIPKLHLAGETDAMISVESTTALCERGGNGRLIVHDQGHLFPTRAARVQEVLDFLELHVLLKKDEEEVATK